MVKAFDAFYDRGSLYFCYIYIFSDMTAFLFPKLSECKSCFEKMIRAP